MFILNGKSLSPDSPFTTPDGTQYPANWLRLATIEQKEAIGITEEPDQIPHDQRYFWGYDQEGNLIPKDLEQLKTQHIHQTKETANTLLTPTDWYITRKFERSIEVPENIVDYRATVLQVSNQREALIEAVVTVEELKNLYESSSSVVDGEFVLVPPAVPQWPSL